jgi:rhamnulokinase
VDYALLDPRGRLLGDPYQYRDSRTDGAMEAVWARLPKERIYAETGIQFMFFNTLYQLHAELETEPARLRSAGDLLFLPDLISFWLCGVKVQERTIASTSQLWNPLTRDWSEELLKKLDLPRHLFRPVTEPGTVLGELLPAVREETGLGAIPVIAVAGHDTGSAVAGAPLSAEAPVFLSSGTWSIMGMESPAPVLDEAALAHGFSNEAGVFGTTRLLKNICGMWILEKLREQWAREDAECDHDTLMAMAAEATPFRSLIDPDDARFAKPGNMAERMREYCLETGQDAPATQGDHVRCAFESLACKYRLVFDQLESLAGRRFPSLRIVGGGGRNTLLNQFTANALGRPVAFGPVEATSLGNLLMQLVASDAISDLEAGRALVERSFSTEHFTPESPEAWEAPVARLRSYLRQHE